MAKLYSEKLNKYYDMSEAEVLAQEEAAYDAEMAAIEEKKANKETRLREVEDAYDAAYEAYVNAIRMKDEFVSDYGSIQLKRTFESTDKPMYSPMDLMTSLYSLFDICSCGFTYRQKTICRN
jgi:hypothetical protein